MANKKKYATAADFGRRDIDLTITVIDDYGKEQELLLPIRTLSFFQVDQIKASLPDPDPPVKSVEKDAAGIPRPVFDYNNAGYIAQKTVRQNERMHKLMLAAIRQDLMPIPGNDDNEKLEYIKQNFDASVVNAVMIQLNTLAVEARAQIDTRASTFHAGRITPLESDEPSTDTDISRVGSDTGTG